jgi:hypothetical protein
MEINSGINIKQLKDPAIKKDIFDFFFKHLLGVEITDVDMV